MRDFLLSVWARATTQVGSLFGHGVAGAAIFLYIFTHPAGSPAVEAVRAVGLVFTYREASNIIEYMVEHRELPPFAKWADCFTDLWGPLFAAALLAGILTGMF